MKSPHFVYESVFLRTPMAIALGSAAFMVGLLRLIRLSTRFTALMIRGESPVQAMSKLETKHRPGTPTSLHGD